MNNTSWNISRIRKLAGMSAPDKLNENRWSDDDAEYDDPDARIAGEDPRQKAFEKRNRKELKAADKAAPPAKKAEEVKPAEKKAEAPAKKAEEVKPAEKKADVAAEEAKKRGRAANPDSFNQHAKANAKSMTRGQFITWAAEKHNKGKNYASSLFAKYNPKSSRELKEATEVWILTHPQAPTFVLAENRELNRFQWVDSTSPFDQLSCLSEKEAQKMVKYMSEWKGQYADIEKIVFED